uniref:hypothetical protein n=1 Tax=Paractinoplanes polyasparticus TaxID=2856853 RepID=UPI001C843727|nr:hypothetical protein [Actinoplanes polyasparticus]
MRLPAARGWFLETSHADTVQLSGWFNQVADVDRDWPHGTAPGDTRDFTFHVRSRAPSGTPGWPWCASC